METTKHLFVTSMNSFVWVQHQEWTMSLINTEFYSWSEFVQISFNRPLANWKWKIIRNKWIPTNHNKRKKSLDFGELIYRRVNISESLHIGELTWSYARFTPNLLNGLTKLINSPGCRYWIEHKVGFPLGVKCSARDFSIV